MKQKEQTAEVLLNNLEIKENQVFRHISFVSLSSKLQKNPECESVQDFYLLPLHSSLKFAVGIF